LTTGPAGIGAITIDCDDVAAMRTFYKEALGGVDIPSFHESIRVGGMPLNSRELEDWVRPTWPGGDMQIDFEFLVPVGQLEQQEARLISLGAEKSPHQDPGDIDRRRATPLPLTGPGRFACASRRSNRQGISSSSSFDCRGGVPGLIRLQLLELGGGLGVEPGPPQEPDRRFRSAHCVASAA
jgi:hypothetical protein